MMRIVSQCEDCPQTPGIELCIQCFSSGVEVSSHKKTHRYRVRDNKAAVKVFNESWSAFEELALLAAIEKHGLGNWKDIASEVSSKNERRCEEHYLDEYLGRFGAILPAQTLKNGQYVDSDEFLSEEDKVESKKRRLTSSNAENPGLASESSSEHTNAPLSLWRVAPLSPSSGPPLGAEWDPLPGTPFEREKFRERSRATHQQVLEKIATLPGAELSGYMPLRGDFDIEHENEAESLLADMEFSPSDPTDEVKLKLEVIRIYNAKLDEREKRKRFVVERNLFDYKKIQNTEKKRPQDERELVARMRVFARFHSREEHEKFVEGILQAKRIRKRIQELQEFRRLGIRTLKESELYEYEKEVAKAAEAGSDASTRYIVRRRTDHTEAQKDSTKVIGDDEFLKEAPGVHLLSEKEKQLCRDVRLLPKYYLAIKDALIAESLRLGYLSKERARTLLSIDISKTGEVFDFFVSCGWLQEEPPQATK